MLDFPSFAIRSQRLRLTLFLFKLAHNLCERSYPGRSAWTESPLIEIFLFRSSYHVEGLRLLLTDVAVWVSTSRIHLTRGSVSSYCLRFFFFNKVFYLLIRESSILGWTGSQSRRFWFYRFPKLCAWFSAIWHSLCYSGNRGGLLSQTET